MEDEPHMINDYIMFFINTLSFELSGSQISASHSVLWSGI